MAAGLDQNLVAAASEAVERVYRPGWHFVGAALRGASGQIHVGVNLQAYVTRISVCAEPVALGHAVLADDVPLVAAVAVFKAGPEAAPVVCSPCGMCREMLHDYGGPDLPVTVPGPSRARVLRAAELLPEKYVREDR